MSATRTRAPAESSPSIALKRSQRGWKNPTRSAVASPNAPPTLRGRLAQMPFAHPYKGDGVRICRVEAITNLEQSFAEAQPRALIQMATGAGKTLTACAFTYRLIKHAGARNVLFLVDRANLGRQALAEFHQFVTPDTGRKFTELYNVQHLTSNQLDPVARVTICTIQRLYAILRQFAFVFLKCIPQGANNTRRQACRHTSGTNVLPPPISLELTPL